MFLCISKENKYLFGISVVAFYLVTSLIIYIYSNLIWPLPSRFLWSVLSLRETQNERKRSFSHTKFILLGSIFFNIVSWQINRLLLSSQGLIEWGRISEGSFFFEISNRFTDQEMVGRASLFTLIFGKLFWFCQNLQNDIKKSL